jgi:hypothetical protein
MARALPDPIESRLSCQPLVRVFGLPAARVTRSGYRQPGDLVFGQLFGPPLGGSLEPLCSPPTIRDSSFSSSVRSVSLDSVSFLSFMDPPLETVVPARVPRSGQVQLLPGPLVFGQVFGPPCGGTWPPLCAPPTIWDRSFSSSVRRVSLDSVSFLSFKNPPPPFGMPEEPSRAGSMFGQPSEWRRFYRRDPADMDPSIHVVRSATTLAPWAIICRH